MGSENEDISELYRRNVPIAPEKLMDLYRLHRSYTEHEDNLINQRQNWNLAIQGFLFAVYGFSLQKLLEVQAHALTGSLQTTEIGPSVPNALDGIIHQDSFQDLRLLVAVVPLVGFAVSVFAMFSIEAARIAIEGVRRNWEFCRRVAPDNAPTLPWLVSGGSDLALNFGFYAPRMITWVFAVAWSSLYLDHLGFRFATSYPLLLAVTLWTIVVIRDLRVGRNKFKQKPPGA